MNSTDCLFAFGPPERGFYVLIKRPGMIAWIDLKGLPVSKERGLLDAVDSLAEIIIARVEGRARHFVKVDWAATHYRQYPREVRKITRIAESLLVVSRMADSEPELAGPPNSPTGE